MIQTLKFNDHQEWLQARREGIGSSEVGTILGLNKFETPYQLWRRKRGIDPPEEENFFMKAGHYLEDAVSRFFADETGVEIIKASAGEYIVVNDEKPFLRVSPDRTYWLPNMVRNAANKGIVECKTTQLPISEDDIPMSWFTQLQYQLGVTGMKQGAIAWLTQGREFGYVTYDFDPDYFQFIVGKAEDFWKECIVGGAEPPAISAEDVLIKAPQSVTGKTIEATEELAKAIGKLKNMKKGYSVLESRIDAASEAVKLAMGDAEAITYNGSTLVTWKSGKKESFRFDAKRYEAEHPDLCKDYMVKTFSRRFLVK